VEGAGDFERSIRDGICWSVADRRGRCIGVENSVESIVRDELAVGGGGGGASLSCKAVELDIKQLDKKFWTNLSR